LISNKFSLPNGSEPTDDLDPETLAALEDKKRRLVAHAVENPHQIKYKAFARKEANPASARKRWGELRRFISIF
jgi:hypothetical protein